MMAYTDIAGVRAQSAGDDVSDPSVFPDALITAAIAFAEELIDEATFTSFEAKAFTSITTGDGTNRTNLEDEITGRRIPYPRSLTSVTVDGVVVADTSGWVLGPAGFVERDTGTFPVPTLSRNVTIIGTAGRTATAPARIKTAAEMIARDHLLTARDRTSQRALQTTTEFGVQVFAQPGKHGPTGIPEVNEILRTYEASIPAVA